MNELVFKTPTDTEFIDVCVLIDEYELDNRNLYKNEFTIALLNNKLVAFGRLREHNDCKELCSIGVIKKHRTQKIGSSLIKHMINNVPAPIYVVCIIPEYFKKFGFKITRNYPLSIKNKMDYCTNDLPVPETYVAMVLENF